MHVYACVCMHVHACVCVHACACMRVRACACVHAYACVFVLAVSWEAVLVCAILFLKRDRAHSGDARSTACCCALQRDAMCCVSQCIAVCCSVLQAPKLLHTTRSRPATHGHAQHTATHATHCNTLQRHNVTQPHCPFCRVLCEKYSEPHSPFCAPPVFVCPFYRVCCRARESARAPRFCLPFW